LNPAVRWGLRFPDDHQVNNRLLIKALHAAALTAGVDISTRTTVLSLLTDRIANRTRISGVETDRGRVASSQVVLAAGCWSGQIHPRPQVTPVRGQMMAVEMDSPPLQHVIYSSRGYLVPRRDGSLIGGSTTEIVGYDRRNTPAGMASIIANCVEMMPTFARLSLLETWAGLRPRVDDQLPVLGADPAIDGLFHATGHYRNGILLAPLTGHLLVDLITGETPSFDLTAFSPARLNASTVAG